MQINQLIKLPSSSKERSAFRSYKIAICVVITWLSFANSTYAVFNADFTIDVASGCSPLVVQITDKSTEAVSILWNYGDGSTSTAGLGGTHSHIFNVSSNVTTFTITLTAYNSSTGTDIATKTVEVTPTRSANLSISNTAPCPNEQIELDFNQATRDSVLWNFGDGIISRDMSTHPMKHTYTDAGTYSLNYTTYYLGCSENKNYSINASGPKATFSVTPDSVCKGSPVNFSITGKTNVDSILWETGESGYTTSQESFTYAYNTSNNKYIKLNIFDASNKQCVLKDTVHVFQVSANISYNPPICAGQPLNLTDNNVGGNDTYFWDMGDGTTYSKRFIQHPYANEGSYEIKHVHTNHKGCKSDTVKESVYAYTPPDIELGQNWYICEGESRQLEASGGDSISWNPTDGLDDPHSYTPIAKPSATKYYQVKVIDKATECFTSGVIVVTVQKEPNWNVNLSPYPDTTIIIGDTLRFHADSISNYNYSWSPDYQSLSNLDIAGFVALPLESTTYTLSLSDTNKCFSSAFDINVTVREEYKLGVADAFSPNGDGTNDKIYVNSWGIKNLIEFRIYNRWGKEVFSTDNVSEGWDGNIDGKPAAIDTYAYTLKAEMWNDEVSSKTGTFSLIR